MYKINFFLLLILIPFILFSCGSQPLQGIPQETPSVEFNQFVEINRLKSLTEFAEWWNNKENKNWKWCNYQNSGYPVTEGQIVLQWPDNDNACQVFESKLINCYRATVLFQYIFGGEAIYLSQLSGNWSHEVLLLNTEKKYSYISCSGTFLKFGELIAGNKEDAIKELNEIYKRWTELK